MGKRRKSRELALQALYLSEFAELSASDALQMLKERFEADRQAYGYARELVEGVVAHWEEINDTITRHAVHWRMDRMSIIDRNIMRVAIFELFHKDDVPATVAINEAIEVAKRFSTEEAGPFINGILDAVGRSVTAP